jgi:cytochrome c
MIKQSFAICFFSLSLAFATGTSYAMEKPDLTMGQQLFSATKLGTNGKSCASCHPEGKGLHELAAYDDDMLREMINFCIRDAQKGKMLPLDSQEIESMLIYLRTLPGQN